MQQVVLYCIHITVLYVVLKKLGVAGGSHHLHIWTFTSGVEELYTKQEIGLTMQLRVYTVCKNFCPTTFTGKLNHILRFKAETPCSMVHAAAK